MLREKLNGIMVVAMVAMLTSCGVGSAPPQSGININICNSAGTTGDCSQEAANTNTAQISQPGGGGGIPPFPSLPDGGIGGTDGGIPDGGDPYHAYHLAKATTADSTPLENEGIPQVPNINVTVGFAISESIFMPFSLTHPIIEPFPITVYTSFSGLGQVDVGMTVHCPAGQQSDRFIVLSDVVVPYDQDTELEADLSLIPFHDSMFTGGFACHATFEIHSHPASLTNYTTLLGATSRFWMALDDTDPTQLIIANTAYVMEATNPGGAVTPELPSDAIPGVLATYLPIIPVLATPVVVPDPEEGTFDEDLENAEP